MAEYKKFNNFEERIESKHGKIGMPIKNIYRKGHKCLF